MREVVRGSVASRDLAILSRVGCGIVGARNLQRVHIASPFDAVEVLEGRLVGDDVESDGVLDGRVVALTGALAAPEPEAHAYGYGHYVPALYNSYPNWPGVSTPYGSSTCFGCRGKRSAEAEPAYGYGYPAYGYPAYGYRAALYPGVAGHPTGTSFVARSPQGLRGKREAEAEPEAEAYRADRKSVV